MLMVSAIVTLDTGNVLMVAMACIVRCELAWLVLINSGGVRTLVTWRRVRDLRFL